MENKVVYVVLVMMVAVIAVGSIAIASNLSGFASRASSSIGQPSYSPICEDSDGGKFSQTPGYVTYEGKHTLDACYGTNAVVEYTCTTQNTKKTYGLSPIGDIVQCPSRYPNCAIDKKTGAAYCQYSSYAVDQRAA